MRMQYEDYVVYRGEMRLCQEGEDHPSFRNWCAKVVCAKLACRHIRLVHVLEFFQSLQE